MAPVADIILAAINRMPKKGTITGTDLLLLQGLDWLLKDTENFVMQAQGLIAGCNTDSILDGFLKPVSGKTELECPVMKISEIETIPEIIPPVVKSEIPSLGL